MLAYIFILITLLLLGILFSMVWPPDSPWSPWWRTNRQMARRQCKLAKIGKDDVVYDLGCGDGTALITAAKEFGARGVGVEIDPIRYWIARIRVLINGLSGKITIVRKNFFEVDVSEASVVIMYLIPKTLNRLKPKLVKELKPGSRLITFVYRVDLPQADEDKHHELYLYRIPKK
jgi:SAM-dependent methyltransferase